MREIPAEVAALLKSRSMIGANKPISKLLIGDKVSSGINTKVFKLGVEPSNWQDVDFDDSGWQFASIQADPLLAWVAIDNAEPIWTDTVLSNDICLFRHSFILNEIPQSVNIYYNHDNDLHGLYINGTLIVTHVYGSDDYLPYYKTIYSFDITPYLQTGKNIISAKVRNFEPAAMIQFALDIQGFIELRPKSVQIARNKGMAGSLSLSIDNKDGKYSPDNTEYANMFFPNKNVVVKQGYGSNLIKTFTGLIDRVEMTTFPQELKLSVRDKLKLALDQIVTSETSHIITYTLQTVEAIFTDLCKKAGLATGTVEVTGLTLAEKIFSWETYADCFQWLADLVGFEYGADEEGLIYFRRETIPSVPTVAYVFKEGEDIVSLGYTIDDNDIYSCVVVYGKDSNDMVITATKDYVSKEYYNVLPQKIMKIDASDADTTEKCQVIADKAEMLMRSRVREVSFACIAVPWLQIGDIIQVIESSTTISELYRVTDLSTIHNDKGYTMQITCYHHSSA